MSRDFTYLGELKQLFSPLPRPRTEAEAMGMRESQVQLVQLMMPMSLVNMGNGAAVALAYSSYAHWAIVSAWFGMLFMFSAFQFYSSLKMSKSEVPERVSGGMLRKAEGGSIGLGLLWGATVFIFHSDNPLSNLFISIIIAGMGAGTVAIMGPVSRISSRFLAASMLVLLIGTVYLTPPFAMATFFMCVTLTVALIAGCARNQYHLKLMVGRQVDADQARNRLLDAIESTNDAFAFYDERGNLALGNKRHSELFGSERFDSSKAELEGTAVVRVRDRWLQRSSRKTAQGGYVVVNTDITDLKTRERELVDARREALEADAAKSRFLSTMSHELRTPLNIILGFSRLMASSSQVVLSKEEISEYSDNINESGTYLLRLIDDIIDYSKVGLDKLMLETQPVELRGLLKKSVSLAANFEHVDSMSSIDVSISPSLGHLQVDENVCRRIVMGLLSNAMRFRGADPRLIVRAGLDADDRPFIAVRDFGNGIAEEELEDVFQAFYQCDKNHDRSGGGTGLGLTLCRHLARLHGGDVVLKSRVGVGTTATLVLPKSAYIPLEEHRDDILAKDVA